MSNKISIRFFNDKEVRAIWDEENSKWWFSVLDIVGVLNAQDDYEKNRNYWKYLKAKLKKTLPELVSDTTQLKLTAADGKKYKSDVMDYNQVIELAKNFPNNKSAPFIQWFTYSDETVDAKSKTKAYALFESSLLDSIEIGTVNGKADSRLSFWRIIRLCRKNSYCEYFQRWIQICCSRVFAGDLRPD